MNSSSFPGTYNDIKTLLYIIYYTAKTNVLTA